MTMMNLDNYNKVGNAPHPSSNQLLDQDEIKKVWEMPEISLDDNNYTP